MISPQLIRLTLIGSHSVEFYQAIGFSIALLVVLAILGWIWLRDELKEKEGD